jgi:transposase-like protein
MLHDTQDAKAKLVNARVKHEVLAAIMELAPKKPALISALIDCACSAETATEVARRHSLHKSVLSYWSRQLGLPKRRRGRRAFLRPTPELQRILELVREHGVVETARRIGVSKQRVSQIAQRWKDYLPVRALRVQAPVGGDRGKEIAKRKEPRIRVISFRLSLTELQLLRQRYPEVKSVGQAARGIVTAVLSI